MMHPKGTDRCRSPIKIVHAIYSLGVGGPEVSAWRLAKASLDRRYFRQIYAVQKGGPLETLLRDAGVTYKVFCRKRRIDWPLLGRLTAQLRADGIQLVHAHGLPQLMYAGLAARLTGIKLVYTQHEIYTLRNRRLLRLLYAFSKLAHKITAVGNTVTAFLQDRVGISPHKITTIRNGIDILSCQSAAPICRSAWGWSNDDVIVGCVARLEAEKGIQWLLEAFRSVLKDYRCAKLLIAGDGSLGETLRLASLSYGLGNSVQFLGWRTDIPEVVATCDVIILPSIEEGLPLALLEAMAAGKAVIATTIGAIPEVIKNGQSGILIPPRSALHLARALSFLIGDPVKRQDIGAEALKHVRERYSLNRVLQEYELVYDGVLSSAE